jgi:transposase InsO family protein
VLNEDVLPTFEAHQAAVGTILSDNGREFCGRLDRHPYELFLQLEGIDHRTTKVRRPQSNGFVERCTASCWTSTSASRAGEMVRIAGGSAEGPGCHLHRYNHERSHQGRGMRQAPYQAFIAGLPKKEKTEKKVTPRQRNHHPPGTPVSGEYYLCTYI